MKTTILTTILLLLGTISKGQNKEITYRNLVDSTKNYYIAFTPTGQVNGLLVLLTSYGESPQIASNETNIQQIAAEKGIITVFLSQVAGGASFHIDKQSQENLDKIIPELQKKFNVTDKPFYLGGFSLGGSGVVKYAERAYTNPSLTKPAAIFAIDPPLDFERFYYSLDNANRYGLSQVAKDEASYFIKRMEYEFDGSPRDNLKSYHSISPYSYSDTLKSNLKLLISCPITLITEPDIMWQMKERNRSIYDLNSLDCSSFINDLKCLGNKSATLILTNDKGYRKLTGRRNPHSWSIADSEQLINWLTNLNKKE